MHLRPDSPGAFVFFVSLLSVDPGASHEGYAQYEEQKGSGYQI